MNERNFGYGARGMLDSPSGIKAIVRTAINSGFNGEIELLLCNTLLLMNKVIQDPQGFVMVTGSLLTGYVGNPTKTSFGQPIDYDNKLVPEDLDIAIIDSVLFNRVPTREIIPSYKLGNDMDEEITYPISVPGNLTKLKNEFKNNRKYPYLEELFFTLVEMRLLPEISIFKSSRPIRNLGYPFSIISSGVGFSEQDFIEKFYNED